MTGTATSSAPGDGSRDLRGDARAIVDAALAAVDAGAAVHRHLRVEGDRLVAGERSWQLGRFREVLVVGAGKAGAPMAAAVEEILQDRVSGGDVVVKHGHAAATRRVRVHEAAHPVPDEDGVAAAARILERLDGADADTLVICLLSGGGSALLVRPAEGLELDDLQRTTRALLRCGATIGEINCLRKHLSAVKGGQLARRAAPATVLTLVLSDVVGDSLGTIASGPTAPDATTFADCLEVVGRYGLEGELPDAVVERLRGGADGRIEDTPRAGDPLFERVHHVIVGNNDQAVRAAAGEAEARGYRPCVLSTVTEGESREVARAYAAVALEVARSGRPVEPAACVLAGGETTVTLRGDGKGGRAQEFALAAALQLQGQAGILACAVGTDGTDGPTDAAGAMADGETVERGDAAGRSARRHLDDNDAYPFFDALDDLVITGPTDTNVMDLYLFLVVPATGR